MIVHVSVVLGRSVCDDIDWRFDNLSGGHRQSQVNCESLFDVISEPLMIPSSLDSDDDLRFAQFVDTSVNVITNSPSQDYTHPDDHNLSTYKILVVIQMF